MPKSGHKVGTFSSPPKIPKKTKARLQPLLQKLLSKCTDVKVLSKNVDWNELSEFYDLLNSVIELEKSYVAPLPKREDHLDKFYAWCSENDAKFDLVTFQEIQSGNYGAVSKDIIKENEPFLSVPRKIMMSETTAQSSKLGPLITDDPILQRMPNVLVAIHLLMEFLNPASFWKPYISILPSQFSTVLYFSLNELKQLQGSPVLDEAITILYSVVRQYCYFSHLFESHSSTKSLNLKDHFTFELYRWAVSVVMTRQNFVPTPNGDKRVTSLVPLFDMCNHANGKLSTDFSLEKEHLISYAFKTFSKGEEVFTFYGTRSNGEFFVHNAFVYLENAEDAVKIKLGLGKKDPLLSLKKDLCSKLEITQDGPFYIHKTNCVDQDLLTFLKINVMKMDELQSVLNEEAGEIDLLKFPDLEKRALSFLKDRLYLLLKCYKTTLEEDEELIKSCVPETPNLHLAIQLRISEKRILSDAYNYCLESIS